MAASRPLSGSLLPQILKWAARLLGLALFLLVAAIAIGEGVPNPLNQPPAVAVELFLMLVMTAGLIVAWRWELTGALATLVALAGFAAVELARGHRLPGGALPFFALPAVLYLAHALLTRHAVPPRAQGGA